MQQAWDKVSRGCMAFHVLTFGTIVFFWMAACLIFFCYLGHPLRVLRQPFFLASALPCMLIMSFALPTIRFLLLRANARKLASHPLYRSPAS